MIKDSISKLKFIMLLKWINLNENTLPSILINTIKTILIILFYIHTNLNIFWTKIKDILITIANYTILIKYISA